MRELASASIDRSFANYYFSAFARPLQAFQSILGSDRRLKFALYAMLINMIAYTLVYVFLVFGEGTPYKPWLNIPPEVYYRYNVFFAAPTMFIGWIVAAGIIQLISRSFTDKGSFENILVLLGFSISIASWSTSVHDVLTSFLGAMDIINQQHYELLLNTPTIWRSLLWFLFAVYFLWFVLLFSLSVYIVYRPRKYQALLLGLTGFVMYQLFFLVFNR